MNFYTSQAAGGEAMMTNILSGAGRKDGKVIRFEKWDSSFEFAHITARKYYNYRKRSVAIASDYEFWIDVFYRNNRLNDGLNIPETYAAMRSLFGESSTLFDDYKCSFGFPFELDITKNDVKSKYIFIFHDVKGGLEIFFSKILKTEEDCRKYHDRMKLYDPIEEEFSKKEMQYFMSWFLGYIEGFMGVYKENFDHEFIRTMWSVLCVYGFRNGKFFTECFEEYDDYDERVRELKKTGLPFNEVRPNPKVPEDNIEDGVIEGQEGDCPQGELAEKELDLQVARRVMSRLLRKKFGPFFDSRRQRDVDTCTEEEMERWLDKIFDAETIDEMFVKNS